jgi:hypothetical protein
MERIAVPKVFVSAIGEIRADLGDWLDRQDPELIWQIADFIKPTSIKERRIWSVKKIAFEFAASRSRKTRHFGPVLEESVASAIATFSGRGIVAGFGIDEQKLWPFGRNSLFIFKQGEEARAVYFATLVELGERAGVSTDDLARYARLRNTILRRVNGNKAA